MCLLNEPCPVGSDCCEREIWPIPIKNDEELWKVQEMIGKLAVKGEGNLTEEEQDKLEILVTLMEAYEDIHYPKPPAPSPLEFLRTLMKSSGMSESDLCKLLGEQTLGHKILSGDRKLSKKHIKILSDYFKMEPGAFSDKKG